jgi:hypothetical protein
MAKRNQAGGGSSSRQVREVPVRTGRAAQEMRPKEVSQYGSALGNHPTDGSRKLDGASEKVQGKRLPPSLSVPLGNEIATRGLGVGGGREVMRSGSQCVSGPVAGSPRPAGRDILGDFGPESKPR